MLRSVGVILVFFGGVAGIVAAAHAQSTQPQRPNYEASMFGSGPQRITIATRTDDVLSVLDIPDGVAFSVHLVQGKHAPGFKGANSTFSGDVVIRTRPRKEVGAGGPPGGTLMQMLGSPFTLDLKDVQVVVAGKG